jgi:multiple sugar transport system ATP-binding protein
MEGGKVVAVGTPRDLYGVPDNLYVARMVGSPPINILSGAVQSDGKLTLPFLKSGVSATGIPSGQDLAVGLRPHDIALADEGSARETRFPAKVHLTEPLGDVTILDVAARDTELKMVLREEVAAKFSVGDEIEVTFNPNDLHFFDRSSGQRLGNVSGTKNG